MNAGIARKLETARIRMLLDFPFFGQLALRQPLVEEPGCKTVSTNGKRIRYDPEVVKGWTLNQLIWLLCHEVLHCALEHHSRLGNKDTADWNDAGDYVINQALSESGLREAPPGVLCNGRYRGMSADEVYRIIHTPKPEGEGEGEGQPEGEGEGEGQPEGQGRAPAWGRVEPPPPDADIAQDAADQQIAVRQALTSAKACGKMPGPLEGLIEAAIKPRMDWREALRAFVTKTTADYTWTRPNPRYVTSGIYVPAVHGETVDIVVAVDSSGSVSTAQLAEFRAEVQSILDELPNMRLTILGFTERVYWESEAYQSGDVIDWAPMRRGGTSFRAVFDHVAGMDATPAGVVVLTDMQDYMPPEPEYPVLWVACGDYRPRETFGEVIELK